MDPGCRHGVSLAQDASAASVRLAAMATFRDGETSRRQIGTQIGPREADFARCLAMSAWAIAKPLRMLVFGLPMHTSLDECLLARLRDAGYVLGGLDDESLRPCLDSRWEFVRAGDGTPARYRPAPSYHERLRVELLIQAWRRAARGTGHIDRVETIAQHLAQASSVLAAHLALPLPLLRRAAAECRVDAAADERLRRQIHKALIELAEDDVRRLAIEAALLGCGDLAQAVRRHGTPAMRVLLCAYDDRMAPASARAELEPRLARLRAELLAPLAA